MRTPVGATHFVLRSVFVVTYDTYLLAHESLPRFSLPIHDRDLYLEANQLSFVALLYGVTAGAFNASLQSVGLVPETAVFAEAFGVEESRVQVFRSERSPIPVCVLSWSLVVRLFDFSTFGLFSLTFCLLSFAF